MKKHNMAPKGITKTYTLSQNHIDLIDEMLKDGKRYGYLSASEIVRNGIFLAYREQKPAYREETVAAKIKQKKLEEEEAFDDIPDEQFATEIIKGKVIENTNGKKFVALFWFAGNSLHHIPLEGIKEWVKKNVAAVEKHKELLVDYNLDKALSETFIKNTWAREYDIIL